MSQPKNPHPTPATPPTHVHHAPAPGGTPALPGDGGEPVTADDYKIPQITDALHTQKPTDIAFDGDQPVKASPQPTPPPSPTKTFDQEARDASDAAYVGLTKDQDSIWSSIGRLCRAGYLRDGFDTRAVKVPLSFNSAQIADGGVAVLKAISKDTKAKVMEVPEQELGQDLALLMRVRRAREEIDSSAAVLEANETVVLKRIYDKVQNGLHVGESVILADGKLNRLLGPAWAIHGAPAAAALAKRAENARTQAAIRADEQKKAADAVTADAPKPATVSTSVSMPDLTKKK